MISQLARLAFASALIFSASPSFAQNARRISIQSKYDTFAVTLNGSTGTVDGRAADLSSFRELIPAITNPLGSGCPELNGAPDITVTEDGKSRSIYLRQGIISDGSSCLNVGGEGLLYFPLHRDFLIGPKRGSIFVKSPLKIMQNGASVLDLKKTDKGWEVDGTPILMSWDFFEKFQNSLRNFDIRLRAHLDLGKDKPKTSILLGDQTYDFYKITNLLWAVKRPGINWLEASDDWGFWFNLDRGVLEDRFAPQIAILQDPTKSKDAKLSTLKKIGDGWSSNLRELYHRFLLDANEDVEIQRIALRRLKGKPSIETAGVALKFMHATEDQDLKKQAGQILKINNPKGPEYKPKASAKERAKVMRYWDDWWSKQGGR